MSDLGDDRPGLMATPPEKHAAESWLRIMAAVVSPSVVGMGVLVCVLTGTLISRAVSDSEIVSAVALVVGAALVLGSIALHIRNPKEYERHQRSSAEQLDALVGELRELGAEMRNSRPPRAESRGIYQEGREVRGRVL